MTKNVKMLRIFTWIELSECLLQSMKNENELATIIVDLCFKIHKQYGPGLYENIYEEILCIELTKLGIRYSRQKCFSVYYEGVNLGIGFIADLIIEDKIVVELKSVERLAEVHHKQILSYLRVTNLKLGLLINFNVALIKDGIHRKVNNL